jgi:prephenate dehydrogenase
MTLLVIGAGTMGEWFARTLAETTEVAVADTDPERATAVAERLGATSVPLDTDERFDTVCLAVPISAVEEAIAEHAPKAERAVVDVTGSMAEPVAAMEIHAPDRERLSLHPLFAPENAPGRIAVVADAAGPATDEVRTALAAANTVFETTPAEHDRAMATVQTGAHAAVLAYALAAEDVREEFHTPISGPLDELTEQVLSGSPQVYTEIQHRFAGAAAVAEAAERIADADDEEFAALYREARDGTGR